MTAPRTKLVATLGPATNHPDMIARLIQGGVDVFRLNMAHGDIARHDETVQRIREASRREDRAVGILVDLAGPKIRLGSVRNDAIELEIGGEVFLVRGDQPQADNELTSNLPVLLDEIQPGHEVVLGDGGARLVVTALTNDRAVCRVVDGGTVRSRQGISLPSTTLSIPALGDVDRQHARWAAQAGADYVSLSFVRNAGEIQELRQLLNLENSTAQIVAKIEKREALDNLDAIISAADAVMVARGDLGLEIPIEKTPLAQKRIIRTCRQFGKPVIVATQMLESMHHSKLPTRAEVSDVANAILDGADACMLSGETAVGQFPLDAVRMMKKIMGETESFLVHRGSSRAGHQDEQSTWPVMEAMMFSAAHIARRTKAKLVVIASAESRQALVKSKQRDFIPTVCLTDEQRMAQRMALYWGIVPIVVAGLRDYQRIPDRVMEWAREQGGMRSGERLVMVLDSEATSDLHDSLLVGEIS